MKKSVKRIVIQLYLPPSENGMMFFARSFSQALSSSANVFGGSTPARSSISLRKTIDMGVTRCGTP